MDPLRLAIVAVPLSAYLMLLGLMNLRRRPVVVSGLADSAALGAACTGLALVGPIALLRLEGASMVFGPGVWLLMLALYWLTVALVVMLGRPRLVIYNTTGSEFRPALSEAARQLDSEARWAGDSLSLPKLGVQLHIDSFAAMRNTSLVASGSEQDLIGWRRLSKVVIRAARAIDSPRNPSAGWLLLAGGALLVASIAGLLSDPEGVAVAWRQVIAL